MLSAQVNIDGFSKCFYLTLERINALDTVLHTCLHLKQENFFKEELLTSLVSGSAGHDGM